MLKKILWKISLFFHYLFYGMRSADNLLSGNANTTTSDGSDIVQKYEKDSVYNDLLNHKVTQEVRELRHQMYYTERKSHEYTYCGNGHVKKNTMLDYTGKFEDSDGYKVQIIQEIKPVVQSLGDCGVFDEGLYEKNYRNLEKKTYQLEINRNFIPKFNIENYATRIIIKRISETKVILDIYTSKYPKQFDVNSKLFVNKIEKIYQGEVDNDIVDFKSLGFISFKAYGTDDLKHYLYNNIIFDDIKDFDGSYVLRFIADIVEDGNDLIAEFFDEKANEKYQTKAPKENVTIHFNDVN